MMTQGELAFKYEEDRQGAGMTGMAGIGTYLDLACRSGLVRDIERHVKARKGGQGWTDAETVLSLVMLNLVGGECVEDINRLESDKGFCGLLRKTLSHGLSRKGRRALKKRWRKDKTRTVPSSSSLFRYLAKFHDKDQERLREPGKAFIPSPTAPLKGLCVCNKKLTGFVQENRPQSTATMDMDATLVETEKADALWCGVTRDIVPISHSIRGGLSRGWCCIRSFETAMFPQALSKSGFLKRRLGVYPRGSKKFGCAPIRRGISMSC